MFQTVYVAAIGREHPEFLPAVSIHPARPDAIEELNVLADAPHDECLPNCHNIDCNDRRYRRILGAPGRGGIAFARPHGRRTHGPGVAGSSPIRASCGCRWSARDGDCSPLRHEERRVRPGFFGVLPK